MTAEATTGYHPNLKDNPEDKTGLFCFQNPDRVCGADCMAFTTPPEGQEYVGKQWARCMILVNQQRTGRHLVVLASVCDKIEKRMVAANADARRSNQPPPPRPTG